MLAAGDEIIADRSRQTEALLGAVGAEIAHADGADARGRSARHVLAREFDFAGGRRGEARSACNEFVLAVAGDARDADDLAGIEVEVDRPETPHAHGVAAGEA